MSQSSNETADLKLKVGIIENNQNRLEDSFTRLDRELEDVVSMVQESTSVMKDSMGELTGELKELVGELRVQSNNNEHLRTDIDITKVELKEVRHDIESFKDWIGPIARKSKEAQEFKSNVVKAMASSTGKIIITLLLAGVAYSAAVAFGLEIK